MADDISFNAVYIVESLPQNEVQTGRLLHDYIQAQLADITLPVSPFYSSCIGVAEFREIVNDLVNTTSRTGLLPILHIEAHGSRDEGLFFGDDSFLSWQDFCLLITPLNRATNFRLVVVVAACYGADLLAGVQLRAAAPCFAFIAPSDEIDPGEVINRFWTLYRTIFLTLDAREAFQAMNRDKLTNGGMIPLTAQHWFNLLITEYLNESATPKKIKDFAMRRYRALKKAGEAADIGSVKKHYRATLPKLIRAYFESYFMLDEIPSNGARFAPFWREIEEKIEDALRHSSSTRTPKESVGAD